MKDIIGKALLDYQQGNYTVDIITKTSISEEEVFPVPYLFRNFHKMPVVEQKALEQCYGTVLDVGCGAGNHSLYLQNQKKLRVKPIDISKGAIEVCAQRGLHNAVCKNLFDIKDEKFDSILLLMNGAGLCGKLNNLPHFLTHLKSLLKPNGQILMDSSDIKYMFEDEDGGYWIDLHTTYYGEVEFTMSYKNETTEPFDWLYVDFDSLKQIANDNGLNCEKIEDGSHYDYLARLVVS